jgi:2-polyprenyl-3-methyl-5-hydroxy-6-metoxy-1,4-benzoquinol methylase
VASACAVCAGADFAFLARDGDYAWEECRACGFVRIATGFTLAEARRGADDAAMGDGYIAGYRAKFASKMARSRRRAARLRRRARGDDFLDVGSNLGFMVEAAERAGFRAVGVEVNRTLVGAAREQFPGRSFVAGALEEQQFGERRFDVVYCSEVIEHTADPRLFLTRIAAVMRPGGLLYLTTPHIREYRKRRFADMGAPDHKLYFNNANLRRLLQESGFATVRRQFTFFRGIKLYAWRTA